MDLYRFEFLNIKDEERRFRINQAFHTVCFFAAHDIDMAVSDYWVKRYPGMTKQDIILMLAKDLLETDGAIDYMNTHARTSELYNFFVGLKRLGFENAGPEILLEFRHSDIYKCRTLTISKQNNVRIPRDLKPLPSEIEAKAGDELRIQLAYAALQAIYYNTYVFDVTLDKTVRVNADEIAAAKCVEFADNELQDFDINKDFTKRCALYKYVPISL